MSSSDEATKLDFSKGIAQFVDSDFAKLDLEHQHSTARRIVVECLADAALDKEIFSAETMLGTNNKEILQALLYGDSDNPAFQTAKQLVREISALHRVVQSLKYSENTSSRIEKNEVLLKALENATSAFDGTGENIMSKYNVDPKQLKAFQMTWNNLYLDLTLQKAVNNASNNGKFNVEDFNQYIDEKILEQNNTQLGEEPSNDPRDSRSVRFQILKEYLHQQNNDSLNQNLGKIDWDVFNGCESSGVVPFFKRREMQRVGLISDNPLPKMAVV